MLVDYHAELEDGTHVDTFKDLKVNYESGKLVYGMYTLLSVRLTI
jgi:hypothetical protein